MRTKIIKATIQIRRDTLENWIKNNPILRSGQMSYVFDNGKCKVGDGVRKWLDLPYFLLDLDIEEYAKIIIKTKDSWSQYDKVTSEKGTIYVYTDNNDDDNISKIKIGDGTSFICDLPFVADEIRKDLIEHINNYEIHITQQERAKWNNKVTCYLHQNNNELIVFDKN